MRRYRLDTVMRTFLARAQREISETFPDDRVAGVAERAMCYLRSQNQAVFDQATQFSPGFSFGVGALNSWAWGRICERVNPPSVPDEQGFFYGGQCPTNYFFTGELFFTDQPGSSGTGLQSAFGPFEILRWRKFLDSTSGFVTWVLEWRVAGGTLQSAGMGSEPPATQGRRVPRITLRRADNQPDNCGNRPVPPVSLPVLQQPSVNLDVEIFGQQRNVTFNFPEIDTSDPDNIIFRPVVEFEGIRVTIGIEGDIIEYPDEITFPQLPPTTVQQTISDGITNSVTNNINNLSTELSTEFEELRQQQELDIQQIIDAIERCCCKKGAEYTLQTIVSNTAGGRYDIPENTVAVVIAAEQPFTEATPIQEGSGDAERVYHWGSYSINYAVGASGVRVPLQWAVQSVPCFERATGVTIWPTYLNTASAFAVVRVEPE